MSRPHVIFTHHDDTLGPAGHDEWQAFIADFEGNTDATPATYTWHIGGIITTITAGPAFIPGEFPDPAEGGETTETTATFEFEANVADATFFCSLDLGPFVACTSPLVYSGLAIGEHVLLINAADAEGREQLEPTEYGWVIIPPLDTTAPNKIDMTGTDLVPPEISSEHDKWGILSRPETG